MSKFLYPIFKLPNEYKQDLDVQEVPLYIKWWLYNHYKKSHSWILSEIITGNPLTLNDSVQAKFPMPPLPRGNSEQVQYSGYNLLNYKNIEQPALNVGIAVNGKDEVYDTTPTGDNRARSYENSNWKLTLEAGTYNILAIFSTKITDTHGELIIYDNANTSKYSNGNIANVNKVSGTFTLTATTDIGIYFKIFDGVAKIQISKDEEKEWQPYVGGTANPNPQFPSPISNVTGDVEVLVQNKNKWVNENVQAENSATLEITSTGFNITRTHNSGYGDEFIASNTIEGLKPNTTYTFNLDVESENEFKNSSIYVYSDNLFGTALTKSNYEQNGNNRKWNITTSSNGKMVMGFYGNSASQNKIFRFTNIQLEQNSTASTYTSHKEQTLPLTLGDIELCKIGTYQDYFYKDNNKWYLYKAIEKTIFDGSSDESWSYYSNTGVTNRRFIIVISDMKQGTNNQYPVLCNRFKQGSQSDDNNFIFVTSSNKIVWFGSTELESLDTTGFKTWLSSNNVIVYYLLDIPTSTEITDTTLISQLEAISNATSYEEQTNISGSSDEAEPIFEVQYYMKNESEGE